MTYYEQAQFRRERLEAAKNHKFPPVWETLLQIAAGAVVGWGVFNLVTLVMCR